MEILVSKTQRGFDIIEFSDLNRQECFLQKSSHAAKDAIWFGVERKRPSLYGRGEKVDISMHLTRQQVKDLLPYLQRFVETGEIIEP